jgi:hypothetical protein
MKKSLIFFFLNTKTDIHFQQRAKSHGINTRNMKKQGNRTPPTAHNSSITEPKDTEMFEITDTEL